jgi:hypothetical protein
MQRLIDNPIKAIPKYGRQGNASKSKKATLRSTLHRGVDELVVLEITQDGYERNYLMSTKAVACVLF